MKNGPYTLVKAPADFPGKKYRGRYCYEHHLVYWQHVGSLPGSDECIHHLNGNTRDNRRENLALVPWGKHVGDHNKKRPRTAVYETTACSACGKQFTKKAWYFNRGRARGQSKFYCSRECAPTLPRGEELSKLTCAECGSSFVRLARVVRARKKSGKKFSFCSRICAGKYGSKVFAQLLKNRQF